MIELQGRCKRMSEHGSDEWDLCLHRPDPSLPGLPGLSTGISLSKAEFCTWICVRTAPPFLLSPLALEIFPTLDPG